MKDIEIKNENSGYRLKKYLIAAGITFILEVVLMLIGGFEHSFAGRLRVTININILTILWSVFLAALFAFIPHKGISYEKRFHRITLLILTILFGIWGLGFLFVSIFRLMGYVSY